MIWTGLNITDLDWLVPVCSFIAGYMEMHYRFRHLPFSRYFKREPELVADAPHRLDPDQQLPVTIIVKDAHLFPITLEEINITSSDGSGMEIVSSTKYDQVINSQFFEDMIYLDLSSLSDEAATTVEFVYLLKGSQRRAVNHNISTSKQFKLLTRLPQEKLPGNETFWWGDMHYHSIFTEDFVEFGAPLGATRITAASQGLDFVAITDHSYDLDNDFGNWTHNDPELKKWQESRREIAEINLLDGPKLIPGEEVTVRNSKGRNIHFLIYNHHDFIPGSGDGAENWFMTHSEHTIDGTLHLLGNDALAIAAHPFVKTSFLEWLLINRGQWENPDIQSNQLHGLQIFNGYFDPGHLDAWISRLLNGEKQFIYAGNDAHGNFNYYNQISIPMLTSAIHREQILGRWRTGVAKNNDLQVENILDQLRQGCCIVSNGPSIEMQAATSANQAGVGENINAADFTLSLKCSSTGEFGKLDILTVYRGITGDDSETIEKQISWNGNSYNDSIELEINSFDRPGYLRCSLVTSAGKLCYTNPLWAGEIS